ncbi:MAG: porin family protein [Bacteroidales bacterium]|nr:porin family protein [Candidatus Liminaster caballi]
MKKIILSLCLAAVAFMGTTASAKTFGWGVTAGMNISKIDWDHAGDTKADPENGWFAGVTAMVSLPVVGLGVDGALVYSQEKVPFAEGTETLKQMSIPVHLRYDFKLPAVSNVLTPYVLAGPQFNYGLNDVKKTFEEVGLKESLKLDNSSNWKLDLGVGAILFDHLQVSYTYAIPMGDTGKLKAQEEVLGNVETISNNYKLGTHRIGVAYYF